jgi:hypothetical protein
MTCPCGAYTGDQDALDTLLGAGAPIDAFGIGTRRVGSGRG